MAEAIAALGWVASPIIKQLVEKMVTYLGTDLAKELEDLETTIFSQFEMVIKAAENSPHKQTIANWLRHLKKAYYDTEDIFDELEYQHLEIEIKNAKTSKGTSSCSFFKPLAKFKKKIFSPTQRKLLNQVQELKKIAKETKGFCKLLEIQPAHNLNQNTPVFKGRRRSGSLPLNKVIGRDQDRDRIISLLIDELVGESNPATAIIGIGGAGKTTLAQYIFNDPTVREHFDTRIWVCLSPELNIIKHTNEMIQSASGKCPQLDSVDALQRQVSDILLNSKNTLLVLDDICYNGKVERENWYQLLAPFTYYVGKYKFLVTSQSMSLPSALGCINRIRLRELNANELKSLFRHFAFVGANPSQMQELEGIGDKIVDKLPRSPIAAKAVASHISQNLDYNEWINTLGNVNLSDVSDSLLWAYQRLDAHLQRCFLYCSIFPKGYIFSEIELVSLWVSENFIKCSGDTNDIMGKAKDYFNELIACSFIQRVGNYPVHYKIHDLFLDLAEKLSKEDCFRIEDNIPTKIPSTVRYISISVSHLKEHISIISELDQVRTVLFHKPFTNDVNEIFKELLSKLKKLRVLRLFFLNSVELPELVGEFKHLRFLDIYRSSISKLPESLSKLYYLQVLLLNASVNILPRNLCNLKMLQHLVTFDLYGTLVDTLPPIAYIGNLTSLEVVIQFHVKKENGFQLSQLGNLNRIKWGLRIENLENSNREDAIRPSYAIRRILKGWGWCGITLMDREEILI